MSLSFSKKCLRAGVPLCAVSLLTPSLIAQAARAAAPALEPIISLVNDEPPAVNLVEHNESGAALPGAPDNFRQFSAVRAGESAQVERLMLRFSASTKLTRIKSTKDFVLEGAAVALRGRCSEKTIPARFTCGSSLRGQAVGLAS